LKKDTGGWEDEKDEEDKGVPSRSTRACIVLQQALKKFITDSFACWRCRRRGTIKCLTLEEKYAPSIEATFKCGSCGRKSVFRGTDVVEQPANKRGRKKAVIQRRVAASASIANMDFAELKRFFAAMDIPCTTHQTFDRDVQHHYHACKVAAEESRANCLRLAADEQRVLAAVSTDEQWTHPRNAQACIATFGARLPSGKTGIIATAVKFKNNIDAPVKDVSGSYTVPIRGDKNYYGSSYTMAGAATKDAILHILASGYLVQTLVTDGDAKAFEMLRDQQHPLPNGSIVSNQRDPGHLAKNLRKAIVKEAKENNLLAPFVERLPKGHMQCVKINAKNQAGVEGLKALIDNYFQHLFYDQHGNCTDGCQRRFRDIYLPQMFQRFFSVNMEFDSLQLGDILELKQKISGAPPSTIKANLVAREDDKDSNMPLKMFYRLWDLVRKNSDARKRIEQDSNSPATTVAPRTANPTPAIADHDDDDDDIGDDIDEDADIEVEDPLLLICDKVGHASPEVGKAVTVSIDDWNSCVKAIEVEIPPMFSCRLDVPSTDMHKDDREKAKDAIARVTRLKDQLLDEAPLYAEGLDITQIESIHHSRRRHIGDKNKFYTHLSRRVDQADLRWNEGWRYAIDVLSRQGHKLSGKGKATFEAMAKAQEKERARNLTVARKIYKRKRRAFVNARGQAAQPLDEYAYGDQPKKGNRNVPAEKRCIWNYVTTKKGGPKGRCTNAKAMFSKSKKAKAEAELDRNGKLYCLTHMKESKKEISLKKK
jgi:hypothetical protein